MISLGTQPLYSEEGQATCGEAQMKKNRDPLANGPGSGPSSGQHQPAGLMSEPARK